MRVYLIGFMGSGKSVLGKSLATSMGIAFVDLDQLVEKQAGMSVAEIFYQKGEEEFRRVEAACLRSTANLEDAIIATGGGTPCFRGNMTWMNGNGITIFLQLSPEDLFQRLKPNKEHRPLIASLTDDELYLFIKSKLSERLPYYEKSHFGFVGKGGIDESANELRSYLSRFSERQKGRFHRK